MSPKPAFLRASIGGPSATADTTQSNASAPSNISPAAILGLRAAPSGGSSVVADQVVFTSIRSHTGEGYRIIAASPGVRPDEKAEITRRSPSHGSMCDESAEAVGLSYYSLTSERVCVALHCHAGVEHTARGGRRVYTHVAVLDRAAFERFNFDPTSVLFAMARAIDDRLVLSEPKRTESLRLSLPTARDATGILRQAAIPVSANFEQVRFLSGCCLENAARAVLAPSNGLSILTSAMRVTPAFARRRASCTLGLRYSPSRPMRLVIVPRDGGETARAVRGGEYAYVDLGAAPPDPPEAYDPWFDFVRRRLKSARGDELDSLADEMTSPLEPAVLARVGDLCDALDVVAKCDPASLATIQSRFSAPLSKNPVELARMTALHEKIQRRAAELAQQDPVREAAYKVP